MKAFYKRILKKGSFKIDFSDKIYNKGVLYLEVKPVDLDTELISDGNVYTAKSPFVIPVTQIPIVSGFLEFEPKNGNQKTLTNVRYLLAE